MGNHAAHGRVGGAPAVRLRAFRAPCLLLPPVLPVLSVVCVLGACHQGARRTDPVARDVVGPVENVLRNRPVVTGMTPNVTEFASAGGSALW